MLDLSEHPQPLFRGMHVAEDGSKIILFASERILNIARRYTEIDIACDATFKISPKLDDVYQLFIVNYMTGRSVHSMIYALMERKTYKAYKKLFELTKQP